MFIIQLSRALIEPRFNHTFVIKHDSKPEFLQTFRLVKARVLIYKFRVEFFQSWLQTRKHLENLRFFITSRVLNWLNVQLYIIPIKTRRIFIGTLAFFVLLIHYTVVPCTTSTLYDVNFQRSMRPFNLVQRSIFNVVRGNSVRIQLCERYTIQHCTKHGLGNQYNVGKIVRSTTASDIIIITHYFRMLSRIFIDPFNKCRSGKLPAIIIKKKKTPKI